MISGGRMRVEVEVVCKGMFVTELDRPWLDTPFMLQGFLVSSERQIQALRKHCQFVVIDLEKSSAEFVRRIGGIPEADRTRGKRGRKRGGALARMMQATVELLMSPLTDVAGIFRGMAGRRRRTGHGSSRVRAAGREARRVDRARAARAVLHLAQGRKPERSPGWLERIGTSLGLKPATGGRKAPKALPDPHLLV
ncbi:MAG: DUF3391 domain-containing protein, partial [Burkholderiales bacterium]